MGTTLEAKQAGDINSVYVAAIDGTPYLLHNAQSGSAVLAAWAGTDWSEALGGLHVELDQVQELNPWEPFGGGGTCRLLVAPEETDRFGIDTHRKSGPATQLTETIDRDDTTLKVKSTAPLAAAGTVYVGTEAITYTAKTSSTLTGATRGMWSPFSTATTPAKRFSSHHRVGPDLQSVELQPVVSALPRTWIGKWVAVYEHREVGGVLDTRDQAQLVFAGRIAEVTDTGGAVVVHLRHVLDVIKDGSVGRDLWRARVKSGVYLYPGLLFEMKDRPNNATPFRVANPLMVVPGAPTGTNEMAAGYYTIHEIFGRLQQWWSAEVAANRLYGAYSIGVAPVNGEHRTLLYWNIPGVSSEIAAWKMTMPARVAALFGFVEPSRAYVSIAHPQSADVADDELANDTHRIQGEHPALRAIYFSTEYDHGGAGWFNINRMEVYDEVGEFLDQKAWSSQVVGSDASVTGLDWGFVLINNEWLLRGFKNNHELGGLASSAYQFAGAQTYDRDANWAWPYTDSTDEDFEIRQVLILEMTFAEFLQRLFYSTGTTGFNHATHDVFAYGHGLGIPGELLGDTFDASVASLPGADDPIVVLLDEETKISEVLGADLMLRSAFPLWKDGGLRFASWTLPTIDAATAILTEDSKAAPAGTDDDHRSWSTQTDEWQRSVIKVDYNRDMTAVEKNSGFRDSVTIEDRVAVDDAGGEARLFTVKARNTFGQVAGTGASVEDLVTRLRANLPILTRPVWKITRTIDPRLYEGLTVGDVVLLEDSHARDPETGRPGLVARPALVVRHQASPGGLTPGANEPTAPVGEIVLFLTESNPTLFGAAYAPSADVDETAFDAGYDAATKTLRCHAQRYTTTVAGVAQPADATFFEPGFVVRIIERDPLDPAAPKTWVRTVVQQTGNDIELDAALEDWDGGRYYMVTFAHYDQVVPAQLRNVFFAAGVDGLIDDVGAPYQYAGDASGITPIASAPSVVELPTDLTFAEGAPRDAGTELALMRLVDNLLDHKTAIQLPLLSATVMSNTTAVGRMLLVAITPVFLGLEILSVGLQRMISVAPWFRSRNGSSVTCRVTLCREPPTGNTLADVAIPTPYSSVEFTTSSTTWHIPAAKELAAIVKHPFTGHAWLLIEASYECQTRGLARFVEGPRT